MPVPDAPAELCLLDPCGGPAAGFCAPAGLSSTQDRHRTHFYRSIPEASQPSLQSFIPKHYPYILKRLRRAYLNTG